MDIGNWIAIGTGIIALAVLLFRWTNAKINRGSEVMKILGGLKSDVKNIKETVKENQENTKETLGKLEARFDRFEGDALKEIKEKMNRLEQNRQENEQV